LLGLDRLSWETVLFAFVGCALGGGAGIIDRGRLGLPLLPVSGLEVFAGMACFIGATEELVYRGWLQGRLRAFGWPVAVVAAAAAHAAYKSALFAWPPGHSEINCGVIAGLTFAGGLVFGLLREFSGSVAPPMVAHAAFDLLVYGALARAPWWVWS
jgi:membrane protease YdiL (CAAX protease family)